MRYPFGSLYLHLQTQRATMHPWWSHNKNRYRMLVTVTYFGQRCSRRLSVWLTSAPGTTVQMHCERALVACKAPRQPSVDHVNANTYADMIDLTLALTSEAVQVRSKHGLQYQLCTGDLNCSTSGSELRLPYRRPRAGSQGHLDCNVRSRRHENRVLQGFTCVQRNWEF